MKTMTPLRCKYLVQLQSFLLLLLLIISNVVTASQLTASVDRNTISIQDTFLLTVSVNEQTRSEPDFSALKNDFEILTSSNSRGRSITNGHVESRVEWQLTLAPKRIGTLLIPSFNLDNAVSDAIEIKVSKQQHTQTNSDEQIQVIVDIDKPSIFVQEQLLVTIKLVSQVNLSQAEMQALDIKDAVVVPLIDRQQYIANINGRQHLILESRFAIFPQTSGELTIPSVIYSVVPNVERDLWNDPFGRNRSNLMRIPTEEKKITVQPVPAAANGKSWQPANKVTLNETWSSSLDRLKVGEPVTRTITISADGLTGGQIAPLKSQDVDGLTYYPDQPQNNDTKNENGVQSTRVETTAIIPNHGGEFTLPEVKVDWWDTRTQSMQTATLAAKKINVLGEAAPKTQESVSANAGANPTEVNATTASAVVGGETRQTIWPWLVTLFFALLSIGLSAYIATLRSTLKALMNDREEAETILLEKERDIWDRLKHAAANRDATELRKAVLSWATFQWPSSTIHSLDDVAKLAGTQELKLALKQLDELLYSNHPSSSWEPNQLLQLLNECRKERKVQKKNTGLQPLYKS